MDDVVGNGTPDRQPGRNRRWNRRITFAAAVGVGAILGAAGISAAASPSPSPSGGTSVAPGQGSVPGGPGHWRMHDRDDMGPGMGRGPGRRGLGGLGMGLRGAVRGDVVVPDGKGGFKTVRLQRGKVTSISATSLVVTGADNVPETYALTAKTVVDGGRDALSSVKVGDQVGVLADVSGGTGGTATVTHVRDQTRLRAERPLRKPAPNGTPASPSTYDGSATAVGA